ncbi:MAG: replication restart helicase PriA [Planctomycetota bacterium]|jgi:primosomal protein N' (replication factor Y)
MGGYENESLFETSEPEQEKFNHIVRVVFESGADTEFDYYVPDELWPVKQGQRLEAPFGKKNKLQIGFCVASDISQEESFISRHKGVKMKTIHRVVDAEPLLDSKLMDLARWITGYYVSPLGQVLAAMVPSAVKKGVGYKREKCIYITNLETKELENIRGSKQKKIIAFLQKSRAVDPSTAIEVQKILEQVDCTRAPINSLAEKQLINITERTSLKSLPVIPAEIVEKFEAVRLNKDQEKALSHIERQITSGKFGISLLHGVTDSGKTELYIRAIEMVLKQGKSAIVLLPEIALTTQTIQRFSCRFEHIAVMHSALTSPQRNAQWHKINSGEAEVVIGARSAVFAPLTNLGLIVVDEEHEPSYKQDTVPRYHGRDVAIKRTQLCDAHCILGSATPSLETLFNCDKKEYFNLIRLPKRVMDLPAPQMKLVDMTLEHPTRKGVELISNPLAEQLEKVLTKGEQAILLLNRRGYSNFVFCPACRHTLHCRNCDATLTFHKSKIAGDVHLPKVSNKYMSYGYALCHYCMAQTLVPEKCQLCGSGLAMIGLGSQRLEEELKSRFPQAKVSRVDSDSMSGRDYYSLLSDFGKGRIDILAGTQMLAKGLHFPNVTLVGIISADTCLYLPDFRANERTFQLILQVAGRAGRSEKKGIVLIQTFLPEQPAIQFALNRDFEGFVQEELKHRRNCNLPPYWRLAVIVLRDTNYEKLEAASQNMRQRLDRIITHHNLMVNIRGPMPAPLSRVQRFHRMQIVVQAPEAGLLHQLLRHLRAAGSVRPVVKVAIDVDPVNLL